VLVTFFEDGCTCTFALYTVALLIHLFCDDCILLFFCVK
jgi:hypothetical protein